MYRNLARSGGSVEEATALYEQINKPTKPKTRDPIRFTGFHVCFRRPMDFVMSMSLAPPTRITTWIHGHSADSVFLNISNLLNVPCCCDRL